MTAARESSSKRRRLSTAKVKTARAQNLRPTSSVLTNKILFSNYQSLVGETVGEDGMRYQEALAYRVVQVNGTTGGNEIELPVTQPGNNTVQVLTSPLNGQFYVIGNANDVFTTAQTSRSLVPRTTTLQIETPRNCTTGLKKVCWNLFVVHLWTILSFLV